MQSFDLVEASETEGRRMTQPQSSTSLQGGRRQNSRPAPNNQLAPDRLQPRSCLAPAGGSEAWRSAQCRPCVGTLCRGGRYASETCADHRQLTRDWADIALKLATARQLAVHYHTKVDFNETLARSRHGAGPAGPEADVTARKKSVNVRPGPAGVRHLRSL